MKSRWVKLVIGLVLAAHLAGPLFETADHWDGFPQKPNDIVLSVTTALTFLAAGFALAMALRRLMRARHNRFAVAFLSARAFRNLKEDLLLRLPISVHSPPLPLRI